MPTSANRSVSVKDVAAAAGVSLGTVSNVLNKPDRVSEATRQRVLAAMTDLGFVRNESARQLRSGVSRTLAYLMLDASNPFFTDVAAGIETEAETHGLTVVLCNSGSRGAREQAHLELFEQQRVQGLLVTPVDPDSPTLDAVARRGTPVVIVDRTRDDDSLCSVAVDDVLGGRIGIEHLLDRGHRRVAFIGGPADLGQVRDRLEGARSAWSDAGLDPEDLLTLRTEDLRVADGREAGQRLVGLPASRRPTAAFCVNDLIALGLLQQITQAGLRTPDDLAILGYDDIDYAAAAAVPLSSVRQPRQQLGRTAADLAMTEAAGGPHTHRRVLFTPELVARASTLG
ncbi:LacI family DNA-binding transcriptional regulator [Nocardioides sp. GY 10127]|uniref:LacI family DNA-binding transcriptional regulator n=1 Tax=Nocardioides sp. GY 10127 TaxID=2569762 RepID=UPI001F0E9F33|nr:LacI family DNA-binding transcriptional regulator [Nocardioides sp. GY 10127]